MATPFLNNTETSLNLQKFKKNPKNSNLISFWAFLLSIFIYISVFYIFNLSPSTLAYTPIFWFIISNTLILIIAADFGAFTSSKDHDFFDDKNMISARSVKINTITTPSYEIVPYEKTMPMCRREEVDDREPREKIVNVVSDDQIQKTVDDKPAGKSKEIKIVRKSRSARRSEKEVGKVCLKRALSEAAPPRLDENEFSRMSDEELNRRVEEFIRKCNRQIRNESS